MNRGDRTACEAANLQNNGKTFAKEFLVLPRGNSCLILEDGFFIVN